MDIYRTEEEQVAAMRAWLKKNGMTVIVAVALAIATYSAWNWYRHNQLEQSQAASSLYQSMMQSYQVVVAGGDAAADAEVRMTKGGDELIEQYSGSVYAQFAAMMLAGHAVEHDDYLVAEKYLRAAQAVDRDKTMTVLIADRLARVLSAQEKYDDALALLTGKVPAPLLSGRENVRGDILAAQGKKGEARVAWQKALDAAAAEDPVRQLLQMKLDYVAGE